MSQADHALERKAYEAEVNELNVSITSLRDEIKMKDEIQFELQSPSIGLGTFPSSLNLGQNIKIDRWIYSTIHWNMRLHSFTAPRGATIMRAHIHVPLLLTPLPPPTSMIIPLISVPPHHVSHPPTPPRKVNFVTTLPSPQNPSLVFSTHLKGISSGRQSSTLPQYTPV